MDWIVGSMARAMYMAPQLGVAKVKSILTLVSILLGVQLLRVKPVSFMVPETYAGYAFP